MKDISKAGYGLLCFVDAVLQYCVVFKEVKPKQDKLKELEKDHELVRNKLNFFRTCNVVGSETKYIIILFNRPIHYIKQTVIISSFVMNVKSKKQSCSKYIICDS